jgi:hypothetical protein
VSQDSRVPSGACGLIGSPGVDVAAGHGVGVLIEVLAQLAGWGTVAVMGGAATKVRRS